MGQLAYALGDAVEQVFKDVGIAEVAVVALGLVAWWTRRRLRQRTA